MKQEKVIHSAVRSGERVFKAGDEDALAEFATAEEIQRLTNLGAISGFASPKAEKAEEKPKGRK